MHRCFRSSLALASGFDEFGNEWLSDRSIVGGWHWTGCVTPLSSAPAGSAIQEAVSHARLAPRVCCRLAPRAKRHALVRRAISGVDGPHNGSSAAVASE
jgi:hypothetical protein